MEHLFQSLDQQSNDNLRFERSLWNSGINTVAGTDEVGRGPLAGPVVAACVVLPPNCDTALLQDSKKLSVKKRVQALEYLHAIKAQIGLGVVDHIEIDAINILQASLLAMKLSLKQLSTKYGWPDYLLVDGKFEVSVDIAQTALIKGDTKSASIAAASIVAKLERDSFMASLHQRYPQYNFIKNKGYPTKEHRTALKNFGPCPYHRTSFNGVTQLVPK